MSDHLIWVDCEMTGLNPAIDEICEIAVVITNSELEILDPGLQLVIKPSKKAMNNMGEFVRQMHTDSGLLPEIAKGLSVAKAQQLVLDYVRSIVPEAKTVPLAGNSIGTDRMFINRQMPQFDEFLHYRNIDVSSIKELARRWYPRVYFQMPKKSGNHRALDDILESIKELRYYRAAVMIDQPGPSSDEAKKIAALIAADTI